MYIFSIHLLCWKVADFIVFGQHSVYFLEKRILDPMFPGWGSTMEAVVLQSKYLTEVCIPWFLVHLGFIKRGLKCLILTILGRNVLQKCCIGYSLLGDFDKICC